MASRDPKHLHPAMQELWAALQPAARAAGVDIALTCTWRSNEEQARLYAQGRTTSGQRVTNARPGQSAHNVAPPEGSHALDFVVLDSKGQYDWQSIDKYVIVARLAERMGAEAGAFWSSFKDYPHIQMPNWGMGKTYGLGFRFVKPLTPVPPAPTAPPPPTVAARVVYLLGKDLKTWDKMATLQTVYAGHLVTRRAGGAVHVSPAPGRVTEPYNASLDEKGQLWLARRSA